MKKAIFIACIAATICSFQACINLGKEKTYNGVELYHTPDVSDSIADSLGNYLVNSQFADGNAKTAQLTYNNGVYHFRYAVKSGADKADSIQKPVQYFASVLSSAVFSNRPVTVELCDDHMKTLKSFASKELGKKMVVNGVELYHTSAVTDAQTDSLANFLVKNQFATGKSITVQINKTANVYQFRIVVRPGVADDTAYVNNAKAFAASISTDVFGHAPVEIDLCDKYLNTILVVPMQKP